MNKKSRKNRKAQVHLSAPTEARKRLVSVRALRLLAPVVALGVIIGLGASCGDRTQSVIAAAQLIPACETYLETLQHCTSHLGKAAEANVDGRLHAMLQQLSVSGKSDEEKAQMKLSCEANAKRIAEACK